MKVIPPNGGNDALSIESNIIYRPGPGTENLYNELLYFAQKNVILDRRNKFLKTEAWNMSLLSVWLVGT